MIDVEPLSDWDRIDAILESPHVLAVSESLQLNDPSNGGRPAHHSAYALVLVHVLAKRVYGGRVRKAIIELGHPWVWARLRRRVCGVYPDRPHLWLADKPPRRHHYLHFRDTYLCRENGVSALTDALEDSGVTLTGTLDLCHGDRRSLTNPRESHVIRGDGKVISAATRHRPDTPVCDAETGEVLRYRRADPEVGSYKEGGAEKPVRGHRYVTLSARGSGPYERAILGIAPASNTEMEAVETLLGRLAPRLTIDALLYDGAPRGKDIDRVHRKFGIPVMSPTAAKRRETEDAPRIDHEVKIEIAAAKAADGTIRSIEIWAYRGSYCEVEFNENGDRVFLPLTVQRIQCRGRNRFRLYGEYLTRDGSVVRLRHFENDADKVRKLNRCEHARPHPMDGKTYGRLYPTRADAEALHRQMEDSLWQKRSNAYGRRRVLVDLLAWALGENAITSAVCRRRAGEPPPAMHEVA